jgi:hypothetical protein
MSSNGKKININPALFEITSNKTRKKTDGKKIRVKSDANSSTLKKNKSKILKYIREKQKENYRKLFEDQDENEKETDKLDSKKKKYTLDDIEEKSDFIDSIEFLKNIEKEQEIKKKELGGTGFGTVSHRTNSNPYSHTIKNHSGGYEIENNGYYNQLKEDLQNVEPIYGGGGQSHAVYSNTNKHPEYGCLKGGKLPTYRTLYGRPAPSLTRKQYPGSSNSFTHTHTHHSPSPPPPPTLSSSTSLSSYTPTPSNPMSSSTTPTPISSHSPTPTLSSLSSSSVSSLFRRPLHDTSSSSSKTDDKLKKISELKQLRQFLNKSKENKTPNRLKYKKQKKTLKRTYYVGKSKVHPKVSVLVSNKTIRKNISKQAEELKQTSIKDVRKYLIKNGFIRVGSTAPNDVLRKMYESAKMIGGEIHNHNPENLLYNYLNDENK